MTENILLTCNAYWNCKKNNILYYVTHEEKIERILLENLPHGSGVDCNWIIEINEKNITCKNSFHVMNDNGYYTHWIDFKIVIYTDHRNIYGRIDFKIIGNFGKNQDLKEYLYDTFHESLKEL